MHSHTYSLHTGIERIIHSMSSSILSVREGQWIELSCSWFECVLPEDDLKKSYSSLAPQFYLEKNQHSQVSDVMKMINEANK